MPRLSGGLPMNRDSNLNSRPRLVMERLKLDETESDLSEVEVPWAA
jgi:hypothetical protein